MIAMSETPPPSLEVGHPAPLRHSISPLALCYALLAAPAFWMLELLIGFAFTSYLCFAGSNRGVPPPRPDWLPIPVYAGNIAALVFAAAAIAVAVLLLRRTSEERQHNSGGILDAGEGRTRFLAVWALFAGMLFMIAIAVNTIGMFVVPICVA
jgi:hypothetical protein